MRLEMRIRVLAQGKLPEMEYELDAIDAGYMMSSRTTSLWVVFVCVCVCLYDVNKKGYMTTTMLHTYHILCGTRRGGK